LFGLAKGYSAELPKARSSSAEIGGIHQIIAVDVFRLARKQIDCESMAEC